MTRLAILLRSALLILTLVCVSQTMARSQKYKVTIKVKEQRLLDVFKTIQKQTNLIVFYSNTILNDQEKVSIQVKDEALEKVLDQIVAGKALRYEVQEKYIVIAPKEEKKGVKEIKEVDSVEDIPEAPPTIDVSGRITDDEGNGLLGANILIKGAKRGTQTNGDGFFTLKGVDEKAILEISYVGFEKREITAAGMRSLRTLTLKRSSNPLDEIQIEAYRTNTKRLSTSNIATVTAAEIEKQPVQNVLLALQGRMPGVEITQISGVANGHVRIRIQGQNSLNVNTGGEPLVIIDGVPYPVSTPLFGLPEMPGASTALGGANGGQSPLSFINPIDIESVDVLKDADATAIYGSRGANGVILITTKKGKPGRIALNMNLRQGWSRVGRKLKLLNTRQYLDMRYEALRNDGLSITSATNTDLREWDTTRYTDWQKELIGETALYTSANATISGGSEQVQYLIGTTFTRVNDIYPGDFANTSGALHFNINSQSANRLFKINLTGSYLTNNNGLPGTDLSLDAISLAPVAPTLYNEDGSLNWAPNASGSSTWINPLRDYYFRNFKIGTQSLVTSANISYNLRPGLQLQSSFGYTSIIGSNYSASSLEYSAPEDRRFDSRGDRRTETSRNNWIIEPMLSYQRKIRLLKMELIAGSTIQQSVNSILTGTGQGYTSDLLMGNFGSAATTTVTSNRNEYRYAALFSRGTFNLDNKYIVNISWRRDGSSRFGDANKFHGFGSGAVAWIFTEEKAIARVLPFLSFGKLTTSYGITGSDGIGDYLYLNNFGGTGDASSVRYQGIPTLAPIQLSNPYFQWEEARKFSLRLNLGFLKDRFQIAAGYNRNISSNQLTNLALPTTTGFSSVFQNFDAVIRNRSWEFSINGSLVKTKFFNWNSSINFTLPDNRVVSFPGYETSSFASGNTGIIIGQPIGVVKAFRYAGIDPATGNSMVYDAKGNPTANPSVAFDRNLLIPVQTEFYGGWKNTISYKGFELDFLFQFVYKLGPKERYYFNVTTPAGRFVNNGQTNQPVSVLNRWQKPGDNTEMVRFSTQTNVVHRGYLSDAYFTHDNSYIRLTNLSLSWQVPTRLVRKAGLQTAGINFQGQNLLTITRFKGLDPESASASLPPLQVLTLGIKLGF